MTNTNVRPVVFDFSDYRVFLKAYYDWKKSESDFSYAVFANRAGLKSRSFLRLIIAGKRNLSPEGVAKFVLGLGLPRGEAEAFEALVNFNQASSFESRKYYWESFLKQRPKHKSRHRIQDEYMYLARAAYPVLLVLVRQPHVSKKPADLAKMSGLSVSDVQEGIETLTQLGAIRKLDDGELVVTSEGFRTSNDIPNIAIQSFHRNMLEQAKAGLDMSPLVREFQAMMVPLNQEEFTYLRERIRALVEEVDEKFGGRRPKSEAVYSLNINLIPITTDFIRTSSASQKPVEESNESQPEAQESRV